MGSDLVPRPTLPHNPNHADVIGYPPRKDEQLSIAQQLAAAIDGNWKSPRQSTAKWKSLDMSIQSEPKREGEAPAQREHDGGEFPEGWASGASPARQNRRYNVSERAKTSAAEISGQLHGIAQTKELSGVASQVTIIPTVSDLAEVTPRGPSDCPVIRNSRPNVAQNAAHLLQGKPLWTPNWWP